LSIRNKVFSSILGLLILATIVAIVYVTQSPPARGTFTEFYLLGVEGKAEGYPEGLVIGQEGRVLLGIENHEYQKMSYRVVVRMDGGQNVEIGPVVLEHEKEWEQEVSFIPGKTIEFLLFKEEEGEPYRSLGPFPIDVKEKE